MLLIVLFQLLARLLPVILVLCAVVPVFGGRLVDVSAGWQAFGFGACALPCYAGITPGVTPFDAIHPFSWKMCLGSTDA